MYKLHKEYSEDLFTCTLSWKKKRNSLYLSNRIKKAKKKLKVKKLLYLC